MYFIIVVFCWALFARPLAPTSFGNWWSVGEGRRADTIGTYELSVWNDEGELVGLGNVATGLTDEQLERLTERFNDLVLYEEGKEAQIYSRNRF